MRSLASALEHIQLSATTRSPGWQVLIYDVRSSTDTINEVVRFNSGDISILQPLTGPLEFTSDVLSVEVSEQRGDYVGSGVVAPQVTITLSDPSGLLDPYLITGLPTDDPNYFGLRGRYLRRGNVVVLSVGDTRVDSSLWPRVFTGEITGQAGRVRGRTPSPRSELTLRALGREANFIKYNRTSQPFTGINTHLQAAQLIAEDDMGLDLSEHPNLTGWGSQVFGHSSVQFVEETTMSMLAKLMFQDSVMPRFDGNGLLTQYSQVTSGLPDRIYENMDLFISFDRPFNDAEQPNTVTVVGLDKELTKITQPDQLLAELNLTTGFFTNNEEINVYWSDDHTIVAENARPKIIKSGGISWLGGSEEFDEIPAPGPGAATSSIGMEVTIDTGYAPYIVTYLLVGAVVLSLVPDAVITVGFVAGAGATISIGRVIQQVYLSAALYIMTLIGRVQTEFYGEPIEWVYKEIRSRAIVNGTPIFAQNEVVIENHLINTQADADAIARETLFLLQSQGNLREVEMLHDLALETGDVIELPTTQRFMIDTISYTLVRNAEQAVRAQVSCFEVTSGVLA